MKSSFQYLTETEEPDVFWGSVGAGILPICRSTGRLLIAHRSRYVQEPNTWGIWGGKLDLEEDEETLDDIETAAEREFYEEAGYDGDLELIPSFVYRAPGGNFEYHNFIGIIDEEFSPRLDWENKGFRWMTYEELLKLKNKHFGLELLLQKDGATIQSLAKERK